MEITSLDSYMPFIIGLAVFILVIVFICMSYHVASTDEALVVTGPWKKRFVTGKSVFIIPFICKIDRLPLGIVTTDLKNEKPIPTSDAILIDASATANFRIGVSPDSDDTRLLEIAAQNYLNQSKNTMLSDVQQVLLGKMREVIGKTELKTLMSKRDEFRDSVFESARGDMEALGLELVTFNVRDFTDSQHVIESMGASMAAEIQKEASLARIEAQQSVAERQNQLDLKQAELKTTADNAKAQADMVYEITKATKTKELNIAEQDAEIAATEKQAIVAQRQAEVKEAELNATVKKQADADRYAIEQKAQADLYASQQAAEATKASGNAEAEVTKVKGESEADVIKAKGLAQAEAIGASGKAYNAMENPLIVLQNYIDKLPDMIREAASPLSQVDSITMYGEGNSSKLVGDVTGSVSQLTKGIESATGINLAQVLSSAVAGSAAGAAMNHHDSQSREDPPQQRKATSKKNNTQDK
ncbi:flotillin family protein [Bombiscardovia coagulans]|uniref:Conserved surface-anchored protein Band 7 family n=1 Tax=Bombiscardovia coagulans TaxID=686666 RepID=A0A261EVH3_9BIFI|nr:flotillin family protein [Bombiscardovia coagulans]OZG50880.1 conserved surface-anchored protein Band 7 family [Bombiscardovia coagulans]